jgi:hypothetical protein
MYRISHTPMSSVCFIEQNMLKAKVISRTEKPGQKKEGFRMESNLSISVIS